MKLSIKLSVILILILQNTYAQEGFRIGPTGSYFFSKPVVIDTLPTHFNFRYRSGISAGISMYYGFDRKFGIATKVLFTSKGYRIYNDTNQHGNVIKHNQSFLEIPLYMVFRQRFNSVSFIRENIGFSLSAQLSSSKKELSNSDGSYRIKEESQLTVYPMLHFGIETGHENKVGNVFIFGVQYNYSFSNHTNLGIYNNKTATTPYFNLGMKGNYIGVSITYQFNLKNFKKQEEFFY